MPIFPSSNLYPAGNLYPGTSLDVGIPLGVGEGGGLNVSWWAIHPTSGVRVPLPDVGGWQLSPIAGAPGSISLEYPVIGRNYTTLNEFVTEKRDLEIEIWFEGTQAGALRGILCERSSDLVDDARTVSFSGHFLEWRMGKILVAPYAPNPKKETVFSAATPGALMATLMQRAHARGTATDITFGTFSTTTDSNGAAWNTSVTATYSPVQTTYLQVLDELVEQGACEWDITAAKQLRLFKPGTRGQDRTVGPTPTVLRRGRNLTDVPTKVSSREAGTDLWAAGGEGLYHLEYSATARALKGRQDEVAYSANGIQDAGALDAAATARLPAVVTGRREVTHGILFGAGDPLPLAGFHLGDWVYSNTGETSALAGGGNEKLRIQQWSLSRSADGKYTGTISLNDLFDEQLVRIARQIARLQSGSTVVGTSTPGSTGPDTTPPSAPTGLVASSLAYQDDADATTYAAVTLSWSPVTTNADGALTPQAQAAQLILDRMRSGLDISEDWTWNGAPAVVLAHNDELLAGWNNSGDAQAWLADYVSDHSGGATATDDVAGYRVRYAYLGLNQVGPTYTGAPPENLFYYEPTPYEGIPGTTFTWGGVGAGVAIQMQAAAFDQSNNQSSWSIPLQFTTAVDNNPPPVAAAPTARNFLRQLIVDWNGKGSAGEAMPIDFDHVEVHASLSSNFTPTAATLFQQLFAAGSVVYDPGSYTGTVCFRLVSVDRAGNKAAPSVQASATPTRAIANDIGDEIITAAKLADNQPLGPKISAEQIRTPHLSVAAFSDNLLPNGSFEDVALTGVLPASWLVSSTSGGTHAFTRNTTPTNVHSGAASAQLAMSAASGALIIASDTIPCKPGDNFYVELSAKASRAISGLSVLVGIGDTDPAGVAFPSLVNNTPLTTAFPTTPLGLNYTVPPTVGAGVVPKYLRLLLRGGSVVGDAAAVTIWIDEVRARKVVGTAEIQDAAISRAKIGLLAVGDGQFESASVGKLTTGTLTATVTNSGVIQTASSGQRLRFDAAGLQLYNSGNVLVGRWSTVDASILVTGTYQSGLSGKRIMIEPDGDFKLYPPAGSNFSSMTNNGNDVIWRGPLDSNSRSGRFNVNTIGAAINFSSEGELGNVRAEVLVLDRQVGLTAPNHVIRLNGRQTPISGERYLDILETNASGQTIPSTVMRFRNYAALPGHVAPAQNAGFKFEASTCIAVDNTGMNHCYFAALGWNNGSSRLMKRGEADIEFHGNGRVLEETDVIELAPAKAWQYLCEQPGARPPKPGITVETPRLGPDGEPVLGADGRPIVDTHEADWEWPERPTPTHYGPMAEDLELVAPSLVHRDLGGPAELMTDLRDLVGVLWGATGKLSRRLRAVEAELAAARPQPIVVEGEVA